MNTNVKAYTDNQLLERVEFIGGKIPNIDKFWKLDNKVDKQKQNERLEALRKAREEYLKNK